MLEYSLLFIIMHCSAICLCLICEIAHLSTIPSQKAWHKKEPEQRCGLYIVVPAPCKEKRVSLFYRYFDGVARLALGKGPNAINGGVQNAAQRFA
jgi:hypothetical protein